MSQVPSVYEVDYTPDRLIAGESHIATRSFVLQAGQVLPRGAVVGTVTASGKLVLSTQAASDGSQNPIGILADSYDSTVGDLAGCAVYERGEFNENAITLGAGWTVTNVFSPLRSIGIWLKPVVTASGAYA